ncbi:predicted protein [Naegleria gruberi]|uniref:Predicted protein n=1 Tax=Naegleria gruberi TaxID=5762 RepID=D2VJC5_NAEGR|nr:uncharacterized protein NAEGRDRAFT_68989 [Naegleria gruberi]EFC43015.1 predicted protein [Naegleria gruberi]|eukprot:XP_002675759.1 predicted protein [Naegleria gruberi strain NEG-M]
MAQRASLEILSSFITLDKVVEESSTIFTMEQLTSICSIALLLIEKGDVSINRRIFSWIFGSSDIDLDFFSKHSIQIVSRSFNLILQKSSSQPSNKKIFDVIYLILEKIGENISMKEKLISLILLELIHVLNSEKESFRKETINFISSTCSFPLLWERINQLFEEANENEAQELENYTLVKGTLEVIFTLKKDQIPSEYLFKICSVFLNLFNLKVDKVFYKDYTSIERNISILLFLIEKMEENLPSESLMLNYINQIHVECEQLFTNIVNTYIISNKFNLEDTSILCTIYVIACDLLYTSFKKRRSFIKLVENIPPKSVEIPLGIKSIYSCCFLEDYNISLAAIESFLKLLSNDSGVDSHQQRAIIKDVNYLKLITSRLWDMLTPSYSQVHHEVTKLLVDIYNLNRTICNAVVSDSLLSNTIESKLEGNRRFALCWRLTDDLNIRQRIFEDGFYLMLDLISSDQASMRLVGRSWLLSSFSNINRILDPLLLTLLDKQSMRSLFSRHNRVKSSDSTTSDCWSESSPLDRFQETNDTLQERKTLFDESRCKYVLSLLRNILNVSPQLFVEKTGRMIASEEVLNIYDKFIVNRPYYLNEENLPSKLVNLQDRDYFSIISVICIKMMECGIYINKNNGTTTSSSDISLEECIRTSAASLLKDILIYGRQSSKATELSKSLCECILYHLKIAIDDNDTVFQVELLEILKTIIEQLDSNTPMKPLQNLFPITASPTKSNNDTSKESLPISSLLNSPNFLITLIEGVRHSSRVELSDSFHSYSLLSYWIDSISSFLPHFHNQLPKFVNMLVPLICDIIREYSSLGIDSFRGQAIRTLIGGLREVSSYCVLREIEEPKPNEETPSGIVMPFKAFTDFMKDVFTQDDHNSGFISPDYEARKYMLSELPNIIESMAITWQALRISSGIPKETTNKQTTKIHSISQSGSLHSKLSIEKSILQFIDPLIVRFPLQLIASILVLWSKTHTDSNISIYSDEHSLDSHLIDILNNCDNTTPDIVVTSLIDLILSHDNPQEEIAMKKMKDNYSLHLLFFYLKKCIKSEIYSQIANKLVTLISSLTSDKNSDLLTLSLLLRVVHQFLSSWGSYLQNDKKLKSTLKDNTQKLIECCFTLTNKDINEKRNEIIKEIKKISSTNNLQNLDNVKDSIFRKSLHDHSDPSFNFLRLLSSTLNDIITYLYGEKDLGQPLIIAIIYPLFLIIKNRETTNLRRVKQAVKLISTFSTAILNMRPLKKEIFDTIADNCFFYCGASTFKYWFKIFKNMEITDTSLVQDLLTRFASTSSILTSSSTEVFSRARLLKRIAFMLYVGNINDYNNFVPAIVEKIVESLKVSGSPQSNNALITSVLLFYRVLITRISTDNLRKWWPMIITEIMRVFSDKIVDDEDSTVIMDAMKFLDVATVKLPEEFQIYKWIFLSDYTTRLKIIDVQVFFSPYLDQFLDNNNNIEQMTDDSNNTSNAIRKPINYEILKSDLKSAKSFASELSSKRRQEQLFMATSNNANVCDDYEINRLVQLDLIELTKEDNYRLNNQVIEEDKNEWVEVDSLNK